MTEVWFRSPHNYIRELVEAGECNIAWDRGTLVKYAIDPIKHAELYFGMAFPWRLLCIGEQGSAEYQNGDSTYSPTAVYPTWAYGEDAAILEEIVSSNIGDDLDVTGDKSLPGDERPVAGQEHRVIITNVPDLKTGPGRKFIQYLKVLQEDYPECIIHVHGLYSFRVSFGMGFRSSDVEPRMNAQKGKVMLPSGKIEPFEAIAAHPKWATVIGFKPIDLAEPRIRCIYNIKAAVWAGENYQKLFAFRTNNTSAGIDISSSNESYTAPTSRSPLAVTAKPINGDRFACDTCSLSDKCTYFRDGAVCSVPGAEPRELATFFKTRDADTIIDGLGILTAANARRLQRGMDEEGTFGDLMPEVSKIMGQVFDQGVKLAKLLDPNLRGGTKVQVNVGTGGQAAVIAGGNPRQLVATVMRELEQSGIPRDKITPEMVQGVLAGMADPNQAQRALEGHRVIEQ